MCIYRERIKYMYVNISLKFTSKKNHIAALKKYLETHTSIFTFINTPLRQHFQV